MRPIGKLLPANPYIMAPLAGYTDIAFRRLVTETGAAFATTEMVSAKALVFDNKKTADMLKTAPSEKIRCLQLFGKDPDDFEKVIKRGFADGFDIIDLNFGCPVSKIIKNGEGAAILLTPELALKIVEVCANNFGTVTVKLRAGFDEQNILPPSFFKALQSAGAAMITVHGRTATQLYRGNADWGYVFKAKDAVTIPVAGSGDILCAEQARCAARQTDYVMIGRGALYDPAIFGELAGIRLQKKDLILRHLDYLVQYFDETYACTTIRKFFGYYLKGVPNTHKLKTDLMFLTSAREIKRRITECFADG